MKRYALVIVICFVLIGFVVLLPLVGAYLPLPKNPFIFYRIPDTTRPSTWESTDGRIKFTAGDTKYETFECGSGKNKRLEEEEVTMYGEIVLDDGTSYDFFILYDIGEWNLYLFEDSKEANNWDDYLVHFDVDYKSKKRFIAEVDGGSLFEIGTRFEFRRTEP